MSVNSLRKLVQIVWQIKNIDFYKVDIERNYEAMMVENCEIIYESKMKEKVNVEYNNHMLQSLKGQKGNFKTLTLLPFQTPSFLGFCFVSSSLSFSVSASLIMQFCWHLLCSVIL